MLAEKFQKDADNKFELKKTKYGESYKIMPLHQLRIRLMSEFHEWEEVIFLESRGATYKPELEYQELIDIRNLASMLAERIKEEKNDREK